MSYIADTLACALAETFPDQWPEVAICPAMRLVAVTPVSTVTLLDLSGDGALQIGAIGTLGSGDEPRRLTQRWARAIYEDYPALGGVRYRAAHQGGLAVALWIAAALSAPLRACGLRCGCARTWLTASSWLWPLRSAFRSTSRRARARAAAATSEDATARSHDAILYVDTRWTST